MPPPASTQLPLDSRLEDPVGSSSVRRWKRDVR